MVRKFKNIYRNAKVSHSQNVKFSVFGIQSNIIGMQRMRKSYIIKETKKIDLGFLVSGQDDLDTFLPTASRKN